MVTNCFKKDKLFLHGSLVEAIDYLELAVMLFPDEKAVADKLDDLKAKWQNLQQKSESAKEVLVSKVVIFLQPSPTTNLEPSEFLLAHTYQNIGFFSSNTPCVAVSSLQNIPMPTKLENDSENDFEKTLELNTENEKNNGK